MAQYQFLDFRFNTDTFHLIQCDKRCEIRPKTSQLLAFMLSNRDRVLTKKELFQAVWQSEHVQDHTLFQLISEIRKLAPNEELINTQPNIGYRWVAKTKLLGSFKFPSKLVTAAAVATLSLISILVSSPFSSDPIENTPLATNSSTPVSLPAISAYSKGAVALEKGENQQAEHWLRLSLSENPESAEAQLLLAESLYQQNNYKDSEHYAHLILEQSNPSSYITSAASDLLSRLYQKQGSLYDALSYAVNGADQLNAAQSQCTYEVLDERVQALKEMIANNNNANQKLEPLVANSSKLESTPQQPSKIQSTNKTETQGQETLDDCNRFKQTEETDDLSACFYSGELERVALKQADLKLERLS